jgi:hypothetical protein
MRRAARTSDGCANRSAKPFGRAILSTVEGPYREGKPLSELIAPDRRRLRTVALVGAGVIAGAIGVSALRWLLADDGTRDESPLPYIVPSASVPPAKPVFAEGPLSSDEVQRVVAAHRVAVKDACWAGRNDLAGTSRTTLELVVGANGDVVVAAATGGDPLVASCVEAQARSWKFPAHGERSATIRVPFVFTRE